jgi:hypothetical protein
VSGRSHSTLETQAGPTPKLVLDTEDLLAGIILAYKRLADGDEFIPNMKENVAVRVSNDFWHVSIRPGEGDTGRSPLRSENDIDLPLHLTTVAPWASLIEKSSWDDQHK